VNAHLTDAELVDLLDGGSAAERAPHLACCERCAQKLADLQAVAADVRDVGVPEPSPLFWNHFSMRVREAITAAPSRQAETTAPWLRAAALWIGVAAVVLAVAVVTRPGQRALSSIESPPAVPSIAAGSTAEVTANDDPSLGLVADLASELTWEDVSEAGFTSHLGADDDALAQLSEDERRALNHLLKGELGRPGGS